MAKRALFVTGAGGRVGRLLRHLWAGAGPQGCDVIWLTRSEWDILADAPPPLARHAIVLDLAGMTSGDISLNAALAAGVATAAKQAGAIVLSVSSAAVYAGGPQDMTEETPPDPITPYGRSKLEAEAAVRRICPEASFLRIGNIAGADALLGVHRPEGVVLDPVTSGHRGPIRSYIGPQVLAQSLAHLCERAVRGQLLPPVLNLCQPPAVAMADLLDEAGIAWKFGPMRDGVLARMSLSTARLQQLSPVPVTSPASLVADWRALGGWP
jgi:NDP-hexose 4-ketoreductase